MDNNPSLAYQTICDHMLFDTKSDDIFIFFVYRPGISFVFSCLWQILTYFEDGKVLESTAR